jgi:hypothetical protein
LYEKYLEHDAKFEEIDIEPLWIGEFRAKS